MCRFGVGLPGTEVRRYQGTCNVYHILTAAAEFEACGVELSGKSVCWKGAVPVVISA